MPNCNGRVDRWSIIKSTLSTTPAPQSAHVPREQLKQTRKQVSPLSTSYLSCHDHPSCHNTANLNACLTIEVLFLFSILFLLKRPDLLTLSSVCAGWPQSSLPIQDCVKAEVTQFAASTCPPACACCAWGWSQKGCRPCWYPRCVQPSSHQTLCSESSAS